MTPKIETSREMKLVGKRLLMSLAENKVAELWKGFLPYRKLIRNNRSQDFISLTNYSSSYFTQFDPNNKFEKWAAVEVSNFDNVPVDLECLIVPSGLYAVFHYKGLQTDNAINQYIFGEWLPTSEYVLDHRPHFEILGEKYKNNGPESEEDIWIPVKKK